MQFRVFKPGGSRRNFRVKNPQHAFLRRGSKAVVDLRHIKDPKIYVEVGI